MYYNYFFLILLGGLTAEKLWFHEAMTERGASGFASFK